MREEKPREMKKHRRRKANAVDAIEHAPVSRDHDAPILRAERSFNGRQNQAPREAANDGHRGHQRSLPNFDRREPVKPGTARVGKRPSAVQPFPGLRVNAGLNPTLNDGVFVTRHEN